ncbi:ATP-binding protein [Gloeobacter kilaueensis]|uniref:Transcriptional regulator n=1 Tax=Gloeobacter kilaueensis (strain ATCC BAA-2537 / CCAP 1431/1 / ULC 316 / JS1) TaxID=1183438 RepID=U5QJ86_GLOK1|nr:ATP-binding protein [Gloeobacter kilaueensis]AGY57740.1 transcriptional regulator [Gloeobacter kilaueensis JS1]
MSEPRTLSLIDDLRRKPTEVSWLEFKENLSDPERIGKLISALSNVARLDDQQFAYVVWGVKDDDHTVVGTDFDSNSCIQQQPLEFWLANRLRPSINFSFREVVHPQGRLVLLEIPAATSAPVEFSRTAYIRIGSATPCLSDYPGRLQALWTKIRPYVWESGIATQFITSDEVLERLDYVSYFDLIGQPLPDNRASIFERMRAEQLIQVDVGGQWSITNLGAILFAKNLEAFNSQIARKAIRFVSYDGTSRADTVIRRQDFLQGYACGFERLVTFIKATLPSNEHVGLAFREEQPLFPDIALRELIANALIHQDMTITGSGPQIELFKDRIEITNPGIPLVTPERFIDSPPRSRNEALAALMRRMRLCEEQGTGIDKVITAVELYQLPPPAFLVEDQVQDGAFRAILYAPRKFGQMTRDERIRACYQHAVLKYISNDKMQNNSLRKRFGIEEGNASQVSQVITQALAQGLIRPADPSRPRAAYIPYWA